VNPRLLSLAEGPEGQPLAQLPRSVEAPRSDQRLDQLELQHPRNALVRKHDRALERLDGRTKSAIATRTFARDAK
jgi:hypothetical protein